MATLLSEFPRLDALDGADPPRYRFTIDEYQALHDTGLFEGRRTELVDGQIIFMAPRRDTHTVGVSLVARALRSAFDETLFWVRNQEPLRIGDSEPEPDVSVVRGVDRSWVGRGHPTGALLVIEVSDSTLLYDRRKAGLYASAGVEDYWLVNLLDRRLEVHRRPLADPSKPFGHYYADVTNVAAADPVSPLAMPDVSIVVTDLLP